jgi:hypothetical protein
VREKEPDLDSFIKEVVSSEFIGVPVRTQALAVPRGFDVQVSTMLLVRRDQVEMSDWMKSPIPSPTRPQALKSKP